jgi:GNAT superfamily N-acetyltransferase
LEDLYVKPTFRGAGIGTNLIRSVASAAEQRGCARLQWQCIDFNSPAIEYYKSIGARQRVESADAKWLNYIMDRSVFGLPVLPAAH